jgi:hypothetical protein
VIEGRCLEGIKDIEAGQLQELLPPRMKATSAPVGWVVAGVPVVALVVGEDWVAVEVGALAEVWTAEVFGPMLQAFGRPTCSGSTSAQGGMIEWS